MTEKSPASTAHSENQPSQEGRDDTQEGLDDTQDGAQGDSCPDGQPTGKVQVDARPALVKSHSHVRICEIDEIVV